MLQRISCAVRYNDRREFPYCCIKELINQHFTRSKFSGIFIKKIRLLISYIYNQQYSLPGFKWCYTDCRSFHGNCSVGNALTKKAARWQKR